ncbi:hypothetical protein LJR289_001810 [Pseudoduganella sp. LjRoot289]
MARKSLVSDAVPDPAVRLAARLQDEADARVAGIFVVYADKESVPLSVENQEKQELAESKTWTKQLETDIHVETEAHAVTRQVQQAKVIARHIAEQQIFGFERTPCENEAHRASLEDKHNHAGQALEHYRQAANANDQQLAVKVHELEIALAGARARTVGQLSIAIERERRRELNLT